MEPEVQSTQETEPTRKEYNIPKAFDALSDEPKVIIMESQPRTQKAEVENEFSKK